MQKACRGCATKGEAQAYIAALYLSAGKDGGKRAPLCRADSGSMGERPLESIEAGEVADHLFGVKKSNSWKRHYIAAFKELYAEAVFRHKSRARAPLFPALAGGYKKTDTFTGPELAAFFKRANFDDGQYNTLFFTGFSAGRLPLLAFWEAAKKSTCPVFFTKIASFGLDKICFLRYK